MATDWRYEPEQHCATNQPGPESCGQDSGRLSQREFADFCAVAMTSPWMQATATQYEFFDPPARLFYMNATRGGVPIDVFHRYIDSAATFQVRIASLIPMVANAAPCSRAPRR